MATFNRMKALVPSLDLTVIAAALRDSKVLEVNEEGTAVRRDKLEPYPDPNHNPRPQPLPSPSPSP